MIELSEVLKRLSGEGIKIGKKEKLYNGCSYLVKYSIGGCGCVPGFTSYLGLPTIVPKTGFYVKARFIQNFFYYTGNEFETTRDLNEFINILKSNKP